jgi:dolichol-phosphate mannosyltransferase
MPFAAPRYDRVEFRAKSADYCICVFVINENGKLHQFLSRLQPYAAQVDVVVADGGSSDGSTEESVLRGFDVNTLLTKRDVGRLGTQMRMAFAWALERGYRGVLTIDGNNKDDPAAVPEFVRLLDDGADHVQGSRFLPGGVSENLPISRWLGVRLLHAPLLSLAARHRYTDTTNGFRGYGARFLADPRVDPFRDIFQGYELHYYLAIRAARLGFRVVETPVTRSYPAHGPTPTKISPIRGNLNVLGCLARACCGRYDPR